MSSQMALAAEGHSAPARLPHSWESQSNSLPTARYTDRDFAQLEAELFWPRVWQMACRLDQIRSPGDYTVYEILNHSVVVVRVDETNVRAFHNVCPHRATQLAVGSGRFQLESIVCPFHGWKWNLTGQNIFVASADEFQKTCPNSSDLDLKEVHVRLWAGFVYINLAENPRPFEEAIAPVDALVEGVKLGDMRFYYHYQAKVNANWKVAQEAFMEAYHVPQTHPQLVPSTGQNLTALYSYEAMAGGHGLFHSGGANATGRISPEALRAMSHEQQADALLRGLQTLQTGQDAMVHLEELEIARSMRNRPIPEGMTVGQYFQVVLREHYANQGRAVGTAEDLAKVGDMHIFPNITYLPTYGNAVMYRSRPTPDNDPDWCIFDMYALRTYPEGMTPPRWEITLAEGALDTANSWYLIPSQDFSSIVRQQRGMHSVALERVVLADHQESLILNMHQELDRYLRG